MKITFYGIVQGVGFRPAAYRVAKQLGLNGFVQNNGSNVEVHIDGDPDVFISRLRQELPSLARIDRSEIEDAEEELEPFRIAESSDGRRVSLIPVDNAICDACLRDFHDPGDHRYRYPFANCTECGARFTVIKDVPFDRARTAMDEFPMCGDCLSEYSSPDDRRFHAQTISSPRCGPRYSLYDRTGTPIRSMDPFETFARKIESGMVGVLKGWGGMHIVGSFESAKRLRKIYRRGEKPYAVMMRDIETARKFAAIDPEEERLLTSPQRPIVLIRKREEVKEALSDVSPGLRNIGIMLPYSGAHHLLFEHLYEDGVIMTSANPPGEPMIIDNLRAFELRLDCYLLHNRKIIHRCDDSVIRVNGGQRAFLRRSRGFVPTPIPLNHSSSVIAVGAQWDVTGSISRNGELFLTQYIGETDKYPTLQFLESAIRHLQRLLGVEKIEAIAADRHPRYSTKIVAKKLAEECGCEMVETQHYHAHAASLMIDRGLSETGIFLTWDGTGYGDDGSSWGGETLDADFSRYSRVASLRKIPLLGGDRAALDIRRIVAAMKLMLNREIDGLSDWEIEVFSKMLPRSSRTSSMGRVLDALSCTLGVCCKRSYEGEPAIKLESLLETGKPTHRFDVRTESAEGLEVIDTLDLFDQLFELNLDGEAERADIARSFVESLVNEAGRIACDIALKRGHSYIGFCGGVSYNGVITEILRDCVEDRNLAFYTHNAIPSGDGGISAGQNAIVGRKVAGKG
ncbi:MAG TPA: carbamoyltransferase HypF [Euryarchaeota archaeon]|nr:carbamoyltransferase HypF [Euryarchaeota archaeon]